MKKKSKYSFSIRLEGVPKELYRSATYNGTVSKVHQLGLDKNPHTFVWVFRGHTVPVRVQYSEFERIVNARRGISKGVKDSSTLS